MSAAKPRFFSLCLAEPFRIFFPLATLLGLSGVSLWPLFFLGLHKFYPGPMHARLMVEGFLAGFVIGFLGTALPRLLSAQALRRWELRTLLSLYLLTAGLHIVEQPRAGDIAFIALMLFFGVCLIRRIHGRADLPPPGFVLVALCLLSGLAGPVLWLSGMQGWIPGRAMLFGGMLLNQGFVLFLLLGVGTFLLPRLLRIPDLRAETEERTASAEWRWRAALSGFTGLLLLGSYWLEAGALGTSSGAWLRSLAAIGFLAAMVPFHHQSRPVRTIALAAQLALLALVVGLAFPLFWPVQRVAGLHIVFLGGFSLITFTVATRVVLGHSGHGAILETRLPFLQFLTVLLLAGSVLRAVGDFSPARPQWLSGASYLWMIAAGVWGFRVLPKVRVADPEGINSTAVEPLPLERLPKMISDSEQPGGLAGH